MNTYRTGDIVRDLTTGKRCRVTDAYGPAVWVQGGNTIHVTKVALIRAAA